MFHNLLANGTTLSYLRTPLGIQDPHKGTLSSRLGLSCIYPCRVNADPISNNFVVFQVLVSVMDITQITPTEVGVHQVMLSFLVT